MKFVSVAWQSSTVWESNKTNKMQKQNAKCNVQVLEWHNMNIYATKNALMEAPDQLLRFGKKLL